MMMMASMSALFHWSDKLLVTADVLLIISCSGGRVTVLGVKCDNAERSTVCLNLLEFVKDRCSPSSATDWLISLTLTTPANSTTLLLLFETSTAQTNRQTHTLQRRLLSGRDNVSSLRELLHADEAPRASQFPSGVCGRFKFTHHRLKGEGRDGE